MKSIFRFLSRHRVAVAFLLLGMLVGLACLASVSAYPAPYPGGVHFFEDGSFILDNIAGCFPWGICTD